MRSPGAGCFLLFSALCSVSLDPAKWKMRANPQARHDGVRRKDNVFAPLSFRHEIFPRRTTEGSPCQFFNQDWIACSLSCREVLWHIRLSHAHIQPEPREPGTDARLSFMPSHSMVRGLYTVGTQQTTSYEIRRLSASRGQCCLSPTHLGFLGWGLTLSQKLPQTEN